VLLGSERRFVHKVYITALGEVMQMPT